MSQKTGRAVPTPTTGLNGRGKIILASGLVLAAFGVSYAVAASGPPAVASANAPSTPSRQAPAGAGCACCGGGGPAVEGSAELAGRVQRIAVDTSAGTFNPNTITAKAGVPLEIAFSQAPGGCLSRVVFPDLGIDEDLTGGPKVVRLPAVEAGEYSFSCQMNMVTGTLEVE